MMILSTVGTAKLGLGLSGNVYMMDLSKQIAFRMSSTKYSSQYDNDNMDWA